VINIEVVIQRSHRFLYDHAIRNCGIKFVEIETGAELENAISGNTAMMLFLNDNELKGKIKAEELSPKLQKWRRVQAVQSSSFSLLPFQP